MRWPALAQRDLRALRLGAWVTIPVLLIALVVQPYLRTVQAGRDELVTQRGLLARELGVLADAQRDSALADAAAGALSDANARLFGGGDVVAASAELASYVRSAASSARLTIEASETRSVDGDNGPPAVEIRARGDVLAIIAFLRALEDGARLTRVEQLLLARPFGRELADGPASGALTLTATITGLRAPAHVATASAAATSTTGGGR